MYSKLHNRLGTAGLIVAVIALVAALTGAAYAAQDVLSGKEKKEVKAISKKVAKKGPKGATGPAGPAGAPGKDGSNGTNGAKGATGAKGPTGGKGPTGAAGVGSTGATGATGVAGPSCDEETGFCELPVGETMTGAWSLTATSPGAWHVGISFPFLLRDTLEEEDIIFLQKGQAGGTSCPGTAAEPKAAPGKLCIYTQNEKTHDDEETEEIEQIPNQQVFSKSAAGEGHYGADLLMIVFGPQPGSAFGTWAVTASE